MAMDNKPIMREELPEYRIYVDERDGEPVVRDVVGDGQLEQRLIEVRNCYPDSKIVVREVLEETVRILRPSRTRAA